METVTPVTQLARGNENGISITPLVEDGVAVCAVPVEPLSRSGVTVTVLAVLPIQTPRTISVRYEPEGVEADCALVDPLNLTGWE